MKKEERREGNGGGDLGGGKVVAGPSFADNRGESKQLFIRARVGKPRGITV